MNDAIKNDVGFATEIAATLRDQGLDSKAVWRGVQDYALKYHPILLGVIRGVSYDSKTDRYVVKFGDSSAKATNEVAEFLLRELNNPSRNSQQLPPSGKPSVYAKMTEGAITSVFLLYL